MTRADIARLLAFVQESPRNSNKGRWVEALQRIGETDPGQPWCACFVMAVLDIDYQGKSPLLTTASCEQIYEAAKANGWLTRDPQPGDIFLEINASGAAHHTGIVENVADGIFHEISGNTNDDGSREGYGVFEKDLRISDLIAFVHLPETGALSAVYA